MLDMASPPPPTQLFPLTNGCNSTFTHHTTNYSAFNAENSLKDQMLCQLLEGLLESGNSEELSIGYKTSYSKILRSPP